MRVKSEILAELLEPTLSALRQPRSERINDTLKQAKAALLRATDAIHALERPTDQLSIELGVASTLTQLLAAAAQRSVFNNVVSDLRRITGGLEALHQIALVGRSASEPTQREVADRIGADRGNFNRRVRQLEELGLVTSKRRGQARVYAMTDLGLDVLGEVVPGWRGVHPLRPQIPLRTEAEAQLAACETAEQIIGGCKLLDAVQSKVLDVVDATRYPIVFDRGVQWKIPIGVQRAPRVIRAAPMATEPALLA